MGQQQLLYISVGIIIVMLAIVAGLNIFSSQAVEANRNAVSIHLMVLANMAQKHYDSPKSFGGGGETFANFVIPEKMKKTEDGTYEHTQTGHSTDHIHFTGTGVAIGEDGKNPIQIEFRITEDDWEVKTHN